MRACVLAVLLLGCAGSSREDSVFSDAGAPDVAVEAAPDFITGASCQPQTPPSVCLDFHVHYPSEPYPVNQYDITCDAGWMNWNTCVVWSYDPTVYSTDSWAYCCAPLPTPVLP